MDKLLYDERTQYRLIRDKVFNMICRPCETCQEKQKLQKELEKELSWWDKWINNAESLGQYKVITKGNRGSLY